MAGVCGDFPGRQQLAQRRHHGPQQRRLRRGVLRRLRQHELRSQELRQIP